MKVYEQFVYNSIYSYKMSRTLYMILLMYSAFSLCSFQNTPRFFQIFHPLTAFQDFSSTVIITICIIVSTIVIMNFLSLILVCLSDKEHLQKKSFRIKIFLCSISILVFLSTCFLVPILNFYIFILKCYFDTFGCGILGNYKFIAMIISIISAIILIIQSLIYFFIINDHNLLSHSLKY